jgi:quercetin dioxygenase-like cupin family protein
VPQIEALMRKETRMKKLPMAASLTVLLVASAFAQKLEIMRAGSRATIHGPPRAYTGDAIADTLFAGTEPDRLMGVQVTFEPGARTAWHNHPAGQYLVITSGVGWVQERGGKKRIVKAGDVVFTPPGVAHWHGATTTNSMSHLAVWRFVGGSGGELFEHVTDEEYLAEPAAD